MFSRFYVDRKVMGKHGFPLQSLDGIPESIHCTHVSFNFTFDLGVWY